MFNINALTDYFTCKVGDENVKIFDKVPLLIYMQLVACLSTATWNLCDANLFKLKDVIF